MGDLLVSVRSDVSHHVQLFEIVPTVVPPLSPYGTHVALFVRHLAARHIPQTFKDQVTWCPRRTRWILGSRLETGGPEMSCIPDSVTTSPGIIGIVYGKSECKVIQNGENSAL